MRAADLGETGLASVVDHIEYNVSPVVVLDIEHHPDGWRTGRVFGWIDALPSSAPNKEEGNAQTCGKTRQV